MQQRHVTCVEPCEKDLTFGPDFRATLGDILMNMIEPLILNPYDSCVKEISTGEEKGRTNDFVLLDKLQFV